MHDTYEQFAPMSLLDHVEGAGTEALVQNVNRAQATSDDRGLLG